jgi:2-polyprenyl-3-methyl-5-hydroxy-6-metoxy-1,4-benzoquinol methylase
MAKMIIEQNEWDKVYQELENEVIKTSSYDKFIIKLIGDIEGKTILDYGSGPGVIAKALTDLGAKVEIYDSNKKILEMAGRRINSQNIIYTKEGIKKALYDIVLCNLVVCIVNHDEVLNISKDICKALMPATGIAFIGFCNPNIYNIHESNLDIRHSGNIKYQENHIYYKQKKEGDYVIPEMHRPIDWYENEFKRSGLSVTEIFFTPEYSLMGNSIKDFIIFKLVKK